MNKHFGITRFSKENYEKLKKGKEKRFLEQPLKADGLAMREIDRDGSNVLGIDVCCIQGNPNYDVINNIDYYMEFNI